MHSGSIDNPETNAGRLYNYLKYERAGEEVGGWELINGVVTTAPSTVVSEVRGQLEGRGGYEKIIHTQRGKKHFYRIVSTTPGEQLMMFGT